MREEEGRRRIQISEENRRRKAFGVHYLKKLWTERVVINSESNSTGSVTGYVHLPYISLLFFFQKQSWDLLSTQLEEVLRYLAERLV